MDAAVWAFVGTIVGAIVSIATTMLSRRNAAALQRRSDALDREERARAFQRDNLLKLQDTIQEGMRFVARAVHEDVMAVQQGKPWGKALLSSDVDEGIRLSNVRLALLAERVEDDTLRAEIKTFHEQFNAPTTATGQAEAERKMGENMTAATELMARVGTVLRKLY